MATAPRNSVKLAFESAKKVVFGNQQGLRLVSVLYSCVTSPGLNFFPGKMKTNVAFASGIKERLNEIMHMKSLAEILYTE